jgi:CHAT domain-containing protein
MGNQGNRVFKSVRHRASRTLSVLLGVGALLNLTGVAFAGDCNGSMEAQPALLTATLNVHGREPVRRAFTVHSRSEVMVFAAEHGIDVTLEVTDAQGHSLGQGDSPTRRTGVQRVRFDSRPDQQYFVVVAGKDRAAAAGAVALRAVDLGSTGESLCTRAQGLLADADAAYAAGQAVSRGIAGATPTVSSDKSYSEAATKYESAISMLTGEGTSRLLAQAQLDSASVLYQDVANYDESQKAAIAAEHTFEVLHDAYGKARAQALEAQSLTDIANTVRKKSTATNAAEQAGEMLQQARDKLNTVAEFHARRGELYEQAQALNNVGLAYHYQSRFDEAIRSYKRALALYQKLPERPRQAQVLANTALVEYDLGRLSAAILSYQQILGLISRQDNAKLYVVILLNSALANGAAGNEDLALRQNSDALSLARTIQDTYLTECALINTASVYATLGDQTRALYFYRQSLSIVGSTSQDARARVSALRAIANILRQQGHPDEALAMDREALSLASTPLSRSRIFVRIASDLTALGKYDEASQQLEMFFTENIGADEVGRANALQMRAQVRTTRGDTSGAESDLRTALSTFKTYESPIDQFNVWVDLAKLMRRRGAVNEAFAAIDQALTLAEAVRLQSANPELRSTLLQPLRPAFNLKISMLAEQYFAARENHPREALARTALETAELARARALADYQTLDVSAPGIDPKLLERRRTIYTELAARRFRLEARIDRSGTEDSEIQTIRSDIAGLRGELDQIDAQIGAASQTAQFQHVTVRKLPSLQLAKLPADAAIVEYWLGDPDAFAWVITRNGVTLTRLGNTSEVNSTAAALHTALRGFGSVPLADRLAAGESLYAQIIAPLQKDLGSLHTLIFAPDGTLHYTPFATLRSVENGREAFLVENHDVAITPSAELFLRNETPRAAANKTRAMLLVSDPVYDRKDPRVGRSTLLADNLGPASDNPDLSLVRGGSSTEHLPRLTGAAREAAAIAALLPSDVVDRLDGFAASRDRFLGASLNGYRLIHVASHAMTDPEVPQASALILSTVDKQGHDIDGRVLAADFLSVRLHADTVVLSGCDTALGKSVDGEGLIGLRYLVLARGARSVVSSLWPAVDQVTADLMVKFYSALLHQHTSVIAAWSTASRATLSGRYADPGTWGPFMLTLSHVDDLSVDRSVNTLGASNNQ